MGHNLKVVHSCRRCSVFLTTYGVYESQDIDSLEIGSLSLLVHLESPKSIELDHRDHLFHHSIDSISQENYSSYPFKILEIDIQLNHIVGFVRLFEGYNLFVNANQIVDFILCEIIYSIEKAVIDRKLQVHKEVKCANYRSSQSNPVVSNQLHQEKCSLSEACLCCHKNNHDNFFLHPVLTNIIPCPECGRIFLNCYDFQSSEWQNKNLDFLKQLKCCIPSCTSHKIVVKPQLDVGSYIKCFERIKLSLPLFNGNDEFSNDSCEQIMDLVLVELNSRLKCQMDAVFLFEQKNALFVLSMLSPNYVENNKTRIYGDELKFSVFIEQNPTENYTLVLVIPTNVYSMKVLVESNDSVISEIGSSTGIEHRKCIFYVLYDHKNNLLRSADDGYSSLLVSTELIHKNSLKSSLGFFHYKRPFKELLQFEAPVLTAQVYTDIKNLNLDLYIRVFMQELVELYSSILLSIMYENLRYKSLSQNFSVNTVNDTISMCTEESIFKLDISRLLEMYSMSEERRKFVVESFSTFDSITIDNIVTVVDRNNEKDFSNYFNHYLTYNFTPINHYNHYHCHSNGPRGDYCGLYYFSEKCHTGCFTEKPLFVQLSYAIAINYNISKYNDVLKDNQLSFENTHNQQPVLDDYKDDINEQLCMIPFSYLCLNISDIRKRINELYPKIGKNYTISKVSIHIGFISVPQYLHRRCNTNDMSESLSYSSMPKHTNLCENQKNSLKLLKLNLDLVVDDIQLTISNMFTNEFSSKKLDCIFDICYKHYYYKTKCGEIDCELVPSSSFPNLMFVDLHLFLIKQPNVDVLVELLNGIQKIKFMHPLDGFECVKIGDYYMWCNNDHEWIANYGSHLFDLEYYFKSTQIPDHIDIDLKKSIVSFLNHKLIITMKANKNGVFLALHHKVIKQSKHTNFFNVTTGVFELLQESIKDYCVTVNQQFLLDRLYNDRTLSSFLAGSEPHFYPLRETINTDYELVFENDNSLCSLTTQQCPVQSTEVIKCYSGVLMYAGEHSIQKLESLELSTFDDNKNFLENYIISLLLTNFSEFLIDNNSPIFTMKDPKGNIIFGDIKVAQFATINTINIPDSLSITLHGLQPLDDFFVKMLVSPLYKTIETTLIKLLISQLVVYKNQIDLKNILDVIF